MLAQAIDIYVAALVDIATMLDSHGEVRAVLDPDFLLRILRDRFLQTSTESDQNRLLHDRHKDEEFLLWKGPAYREKMNWNCIGWIFPFHTIEEMERAYEIITRSRLAQQSFAALRQFILSCRLRLQESSLDIPTNLVKVRVAGEQCQAAMREFSKTPPNLRYVTKAVLDQLPTSNYLWKRIRVKIVVGEKLEPYIDPRQPWRTINRI